MAIFNGTDLILKVSPSSTAGTPDTPVKLMHSQNVSLSMNVDTIDISTKDSAGWRDLLGGQKSFSLSADGLMDFEAAAGDTDVAELFEQMFDRDDVSFVFGLSGAAGYTISGNGYLTSLEISGGTEDAPTYSCSIEGTGVLTKA
jgi:TP901-1 family phage major tail protein